MSWSWAGFDSVSYLEHAQNITDVALRPKCSCHNVVADACTGGGVYSENVAVLFIHSSRFISSLVYVADSAITICFNFCASFLMVQTADSDLRPEYRAALYGFVGMKLRFLTKTPTHRAPPVVGLCSATASRS